MTKKYEGRLMKAAVLGANDGIITTFAVVAGVVGAGLAVKTILILGIANMFADGLSMSLSDFLGERSAARIENGKLPVGVWHTSIMTFIAFISAGSLPLLPYAIELFAQIDLGVSQFQLSIISTLCALFLVGSLRSIFDKSNWLRSGIEMLGVGSIAAGVAYLLGAVIEKLV